MILSGSGGATMSEARSSTGYGFMQLGALPLWVRLIALTSAGLISLIGSSLYFSGALQQTAERTTKMKELFNLAGAADEAHVTFGELRYWLTDLSVSLLVTSERRADEARAKLETGLDQLADYDPESVASIRAEVDAYVTTAMEAVDAYTDGNRVIGNTFLANARVHSGNVDQALNAFVDKVNAAALTEREIVVERADSSANAAIYIVVALVLIGLLLTAMVLRSIVHPLQASE